MSTGTTTGGLPYPNPDDALRDGSLRIRQLAEAIDARSGGGYLRRTTAFISSDANAACQWATGLGAVTSFHVQPQSDFAVIATPRIVTGGTVSWWFARNDSTGARLPNDGSIFHIIAVS